MLTSPLSTHERNENETCDQNEKETVVLRRKPSINKSFYLQFHQLPPTEKKRLSLQSLEKYKAFFSNSDSLPLKPIKTEEPIKYHEESDFISIVRRSDSIDTVFEIEKELSNFVMDKRREKKPNKLKRIFSFGLFKGKKPKEVPAPDDTRENIKNETNSFKRNIPQRHTVGCEYARNKNNCDHIRNQTYRSFPEDNPQIVQQYAEMHIDKFNKIRNSFENQEPEKLKEVNDKNFLLNESKLHIDSCPRRVQSEIKQSPSLSRYDAVDGASHNTYENALIVQAELKKIKLEESKMRIVRNASLRRDTPPRADETNPRVNIVKPKARLPLPNTMEKEEKKNEATLQNNLNIISDQKPYLNEIYGTVLDNIDNRLNRDIRRTPVETRFSPVPSRTVQDNIDNILNRDIRRTPVETRLSPVPTRTSPLDPIKLKIPPKREIVVLQPRLKSPTPTKVSEDKVIATELLRSPEKSSSSLKRNEIKNDSVTEAIESLRSKIEQTDNSLKEELEQIKNTLQGLRMSPNISSPKNLDISEKIDRNSLIFEFDGNAKRPERLSINSPLHISSQTSIDCTTPEVELRQKPRPSSRSPMQSPKKEEIRKSVEAYYWKEIKKIKEKEDEIYMSQMQLYPGYVPTYDPRYVQALNYTERKQRSSSIPRNVIRNLGFHQPETKQVNDGDEIYGIGPKRSPQTLSQRNMESLPPIPQKRDVQKPIFRRGSLTRTATPTQDISQMNKKVSFSGASQKSPPSSTKLKQTYERRVNYNSDEPYGYTKPPSGRSRIEICQQMEPRKPPNYASDSEAIYGSRPMRSYKKMSLEEMEHLRRINIEANRSHYNLTRHESISFQRTPPYMVRSPQYPSPEVRYSSPNVNQGMYFSTRMANPTHYNVYNSPRLPVQPDHYQNMNRNRQIVVRNQVCDIYGKIHDSDKPIQETGVVMGQLRYAPNFQRNSRLTSSVNDIYSSRHNGQKNIYGDVRSSHQIENTDNKVLVNVSKNACDNKMFISNDKR